MSTEEKLAGEALIDHVCSLALGCGAAGREDVKAEYLAAKDDLKAEHARLSAEVQELREALCRAEERFSQIETAGFSQTRQSATDLLLYARSLAADGSIRARAALKPETVK